MLNTLSGPPEREGLEPTLERLLEQRGDELAFVVLFGSRARGDWSVGSDFDLLLGLKGEDGRRLVDRIGAFAAPLPAANVDLFPYSRSEWQRMFADRHPLLLEALEHGVVLYDDGDFAAMRRTFREWRRTGHVTPWRTGWKISGGTHGDT
ncbi:MAG: nucleotidyltransferase domain-containing protein [Chloroflexota bacterium]